jgi:UDP-N-acetylglucosamine acyltransferase
MGQIHPTAIIDSEAQLGRGASIGPYSVVSSDVVLGEGCEIGSHVVLRPGTRLGEKCRILHHAVIGEDPQDLKFGGEYSTTEIGARTVIREFVTVNRGTKAHERTVIGSDCFLMAYSHVAHDCIVGNHVIMANSANLAGHIEVEDWVIIGGLVGVHQFVKIGCHSMIGGGFRVTKDVPPFITAAGEPLRFCGLNAIGLRRRGFSPESIHALRQTYDIIYRSPYNVSDALDVIRKRANLSNEVQQVLKFIQRCDRGIIR